ncbi:MAG TPA: SUMF1/EgtB/PvdO family nonheme iron enzyme, partial [Pyrinomonadaceae bacterium]|nr:SUMF1/EgtB/PvdO family nonheme iron enzyme [Pyrinomonadaceae bacterium]
LVQDIYTLSYQNLPSDGSANLSIGDPSVRVARGGAFFGYSIFPRSAHRVWEGADSRGLDIGFRVVARTK